MKKQRGSAYAGLLGMALFLLVFGGWVANIVKIFSALSDPITGLFIARLVGVIFAPLGAVLGYL